MLLAEDLRDRNGRFLLARGTRITPQNLRVLKIWGIMEASVEGVQEEDAEKDSLTESDRMLFEAAKKLVAPRFVHFSLDHSAGRELYRICISRKAQSILRPKAVSEASPMNPWPESPENGDGKHRAMTGIFEPEQLIVEDSALPTLPALVFQLNEAIKKPNISAQELAEIIGKDTSLSARLLMIVNSPLFGFPYKIDTLTRAVLIVGSRQLWSLAVGIKIISIFSNIPSNLIDMKSFIEHSLFCGIIARILGGYKGIQNVERLFLAGLLHDIGRLVLYNQLPEQSGAIVLRAVQSQQLLHHTEKEELGFDHSTLGGILLKKWQLPVSLEDVVRYHHCPLSSQSLQEPVLVHLSDIITNALGVGSSGEHLVPPISSEVWSSVGLSKNIFALAVDQAERQFEEVSRFLLSGDAE